MSKRLILAALAAAGAIWLAPSSSTPGFRIGEIARSGQVARPAHVGSIARGPADAAVAMPPHDDRVVAFLADQPLDHDTRARLVALADTQREAFAPRAPDTDETEEVRAARHDRRVEFRHQVRDVLVHMSSETRAALRRHQVNIVRLAQTIAAE